MNGWYFIIILTVLLLVWACREIRECDAIGINAEQDETHSEHTGSSPSLNKTKKRKNCWCDYPQKPKDLVALLTLAAVAYYTWLTREEVDAANNQTVIAQKTYGAATRAWLDVSVDPSSIEIIWDGQNGAIVSANITASDQVPSPALQVNAYIIPAARIFGTDNTEALAHHCFDSTLGPGLGNVLFQNPPLTSRSTSGVAWSDIEAWRSKMASANHTQVSQIPFVAMQMAACVTYKVIGDDAWHHTIRVYDFGTVSTDQRFKYVPIGNWPSGQGWVSQELEGQHID